MMGLGSYELMYNFTSAGNDFQVLCKGNRFLGDFEMFERIECFVKQLHFWNEDEATYHLTSTSQDVLLHN